MPFGFFKKRPNAAPAPLSSGTLLLMPEAFYGGADPVIYFDRAIAAPSKKSPPLIRPRAQDARGIGIFSNRRVRIGVIAAAVILSLGGISWYYVRHALVGNAPSATMPSAAGPGAAVAPPQAQETPIIATTTTQGAPTEALVATPLSLRPHLGEFPPIASVDTPDTDLDTLTDREEEGFGTDSSLWDTDGDGYYDGQEVANLYNPTGFAPVKIIDSGLVREYVNPVWQYRVYYPAPWDVGVVDPGGDQVVVSGSSDDFIEIRAFKKESAESFELWHARTVTGQPFGDLLPAVNRFGVPFFVRHDQLVAYVPTDRAVFVFLYHAGGESAIAYRHILSMMVASIRPESSSADLPLQPVIPSAPDAPADGV